MEELALIQKARDGDHAAFDEIVKQYEKPVYNLALRMCNNRDDAFDIAQDAFMNLYRGFGSFKGDSKLSTWIYRITSNAAIDLIRKRKKEYRFYLVDEDDEEFVTETPDMTYEPYQELARTELRKDIYNALEKLKPEYRLAFILRELQGKNYAEIAEIMDCEEGTVKSRLFRAREQLRNILVKSGNFP